MSIHLSPDIEARLEAKLSTGRYRSADDLVREALQLLEEQDRFLTLHREDIRSKIQEGYDSLRRGEGIDGGAVFDRLEKELDAIERARRK